MKQNYHRFNEILFIDSTIKHKSGILDSLQETTGLAKNLAE